MQNATHAGEGACVSNLSSVRSLRLAYCARYHLVVRFNRHVSWSLWRLHI